MSLIYIIRREEWGCTYYDYATFDKEKAESMLEKLKQIGSFFIETCEYEPDLSWLIKRHHD